MITISDTEILTEARYQAYVVRALEHARFVIKHWNEKFWNLTYKTYFLYIDFYLFNEDEYKEVPFKLSLAIEREADERELARFAEKVYYSCQRLKVTRFSI